MSLFIDNSTRIGTATFIDICQYDPYYITGETIWRFGALLCVLLGMPGHILIVTIMLNRTNRKQPTSLYFATIAIFEFIYLIIVFWLWCFSLSLLRDPREVLTCGTFYSIIAGLSHVSTLLLATASVDRVLIVLAPARYSLFVTRTKALVKIATIIIIVFLLMIQYYLTFYSSYSLNICEYYSYAELWWHGTIWPFIRLCLLAFLPCLITCGCSIAILRNRYYRRSSISADTTSARHMRHVSLLLVIYSIYYTLTVMPMNILQCFHFYFFQDQISMNSNLINCRKVIQWKMLMKFCMLLMSINYSNKFVVHCFISTQFRQDVWNLLTKCFYTRRTNHKNTLNGSDTHTFM